MVNNRNRVAVITAIASLPTVSVPELSSLTYLDINGVCYDITVDPKFSPISSSFFDTFYQAKLPSFSAHNTGKVTINLDDFSKLIGSHNSYINDVSEITGKPYDQVLLDFADYHRTKEYLIQPRGFSGVLHKASNAIYVSSAALQSSFATATSHVSGVSGISLLGSSPGLIIFIPLVGGVFFASLERLADNTPVQPALILARDACLIVPKIAEVAYNELFVGPVLRRFGIDAPLNVTSMLRFGNGTKRVMGSVISATLSSIAEAIPTSVYSLK